MKFFPMLLIVCTLLQAPSASPHSGPGARRRWKWNPRLLLALLLLCATPVGGGAASLLAQEPTVVVEGGTEVIHAGEVQGLRGSGAVPGARTVVDLTGLATSGKSVADVLREVPGVEVSGDGSPLAPVRVSIRGSRPDQVVVIVDGVVLNGQDAQPAQSRREGRSGVDLAALPVSEVASLEIVRGAAASLYGANAAAGAVIIRTHPVGGTRRVGYQHTVGANGYRENRANWREPIGDGGLALRLSHRHSEGEYLFFDPTLPKDQTDNTEADQCAPAVGGGYRLRKCNEKTRIGAGATWQRSNNQRWTTDLNWSREQGLGGVQDPRPDGLATTRRGLLGVEQQWDLSSQMRLGLEAGLVREVGERDEDQTQVGGDLRNRHLEKRGHGEAWLEKRSGLHRLKSGVRMEVLGLEDRFFQQRREVAALFGLWEINSPAGAWESSLRGEQYSDVGQALTYRVGASRYLGEVWGIKASHATGYRPPGLYELHDPTAVYGPSPANPDLTPEHSMTADGGVFLDFPERFYGELIGFQHNFTDQIVATTTPDQPTLYQFQNLEATRSTGFETSAHAILSTAWRIHGSYHRTRATILAGASTDPDNVGRQVPGVPVFVASAGVTWKMETWQMMADWRRVGERYIDSANTFFLREYQLWNASLAFPLWAEFLGQVSARNLFNTTYVEMENHPPPGRQLFLTLSWHWPTGGGPPPPPSAP